MSFPEKIAMMILQVLTEFLPVSSSSHLFLLQKLLGIHLNEEAKFFLIVLQGLTLLAVPFIFFSFFKMLLKPRAWKLILRPRKIWWSLGVSGLPFLLVGWLIRNSVESFFSINKLLGGLLLGSFFLLGDLRKSNHSFQGLFVLPVWKIWVVACVQVLAFFPGMSRLGVTWGVARCLGVSRKSALILSYIMGLPALGGAACFQIYQSLGVIGFSFFEVLLFVLAPFLAFFVGRFCLRFLERHGSWIFIVYRLLLVGFLIIGKSRLY